jgi:sugar/nucleoside kinase (ribokinase family)
MKKILGIGNALVDVLLEIHNDQQIEKFELMKGGMEMIDAEKKRLIHREIAHLNQKIASGGSTSNTIYGLAKLGAQTGYIGKISNDQAGDFFKNDMIKANINTHFLYSDIDTGIATTFISSNGERTFATYLGAAATMTTDEIDIEVLKKYDIIHVEGYLIFNKDLILGICKKAKQCGLLISMDMASYNLVEAMRELVEELLIDYVDIIFANEEEAKAFTGKEEIEALEELSKYCSVSVVKLGAKGSVAKVDGKITIIPPAPGERIDTTGAGDIYAAGFLYGLINNLSVEESGALASRLGAACIETVGARLSDEHFKLRK